VSVCVCVCVVVFGTLRQALHVCIDFPVSSITDSLDDVLNT
jgi:hypothetical protein